MRWALLAVCCGLASAALYLFAAGLRGPVPPPLASPHVPQLHEPSVVWMAPLPSLQPTVRAQRRHTPLLPLATVRPAPLHRGVVPARVDAGQPAPPSPPPPKEAPAPTPPPRTPAPTTPQPANPPPPTPPPPAPAPKAPAPVTPAAPQPAAPPAPPAEPDRTIATSTPIAPVQPPAETPPDESRPGWGHGDDNHDHSGPPGQRGKS